jgi:membrane-associated protein
VTHSALIPWLDPENIIMQAGPWALLVVCLIVFAETGLLVGFLLPGDTLLIITGLFAFHPGLGFPPYVVALAIGLAAFLGGEVGYLIGHKAGPKIFERKESGLFSIENVERTNAFFTRFGGLAVIVARFVPIVRTFAPVAAGVGHMDYRKYTLYNLIGAVIWGAGLTFAGYLLGYIPPVADFVRNYIDVILLAAVVLTLAPTIFHYVQSSRKAKRKAAAGGDVDVDAAEAEDLVLDRTLFDQDKDNDKPGHTRGA